MTQPCSHTIYKNSRLEYIDTLKGGAIIFIVLLHCFVFLPIYKPSISAIPLFFVISGLFCNGDKKWGDFLRKQFYTLIIPYISYNLIVGIFIYALSAVGVNLPYEHDILSIFYTDIFYELPNYPLWFLPALFVSQVVFMIILKLCRYLNYKPRIVAITITTAIIGYIGYKSQPLPLFFDRGLLGVVFYAIGFLFSQTPLWNKPDKYNKIGYYLIVPSIIIYLLTRHCIDMAYAYYDMPYHILLINIFALFISSLYICKLIKSIPIVTYLGRHSLIVLCTHCIIITPLNIILQKICTETNLFYTPFILGVLVIVLLNYLIVPFCTKFLPVISGISKHRTNDRCECN